MVSKQQEMSSNNLIIIMVLITLLVVGVTAIVTKTLWDDISLNSKVVSAKSLAAKNADADVSAAPGLVDAYDNLGNQTALLSDALPNTSDYPSLIVEMENIANDSGMKLKTVAPNSAGLSATSGSVSGASSAASSSSSSNSVVAGSSASSASSSTGLPNLSPQDYPFTMTVEGNYTGLLKLLGDLETSARPMRVSGISISGGGTSMTAEVSVDTYWQPAAQLPFGTETVK
jgi:hypothetical protein